MEKKQKQFIPIINAVEFLKGEELSPDINFILVRISDLDDILLSKLKNEKTAIIILESDNLHAMPEQRRVFCELLFRNKTRCSI